jgi:hypothetical protein
MKPEINDYATCSEAYATLRLYHREESADAVTVSLGIKPTGTQRVGDTYEASRTVRTKKINGWFLCTEPFVSSFDLANHLFHLLEKLDGKEEVLRALIERGWRADISCMWDSAYGHGGPTITPELLTRLGKLGIDLWFDIYFHGAYDLLKKEKDAFGER